jgi:hypothetical protein
MASVTTKSARSLNSKSPPRAKARVTLTTQATVGERAAAWKATRESGYLRGPPRRRAAAVTGVICDFRAGLSTFPAWTSMH